MKLGVIPAPNSGLWSMPRTGQVERLFRHLAYYAEHFDLRYVTWGEPEEEWRLWKPFHDKTGAQLVHASARFRALRECDVLRCMNLHATMAAMPTFRPFVVSLGADYQAIAKIHGRPAWKWKALQAVAIRRARRVLVPNERMALDLMERCPYASIVHHSNWIDTEMFKPGGVKFPTRNQTVLYVGRLVKEKNLAVLARACSSLNVFLVCVGEGPMREELECAGAHCTGTVDWPLLPGWYQGCSVFAIPSLSEGHPKALTEAMASGLPCVVSDAVTEGGDAVIRVAPENLAEGIKLALANGEWYGKAARAHAVQHWAVKRLMPREIGYLKAAARG